MISSGRRLERNIQILFIIFFALLVAILVYFGSMPRRYALAPGQKSIYDITSSRSVKNVKETERRAQESKNAVNPIFVRSEDISQKSLNDVTHFYTLLSEVRQSSKNPDGTYNKSYGELSEQLITQIKGLFGFELASDSAFQLVTADESLLSYLRAQSISITAQIVADKVDDFMLQSRIYDLTSQITQQNSGTEVLYVTNAELVKSILTGIIRPNAVFDEAATEAARQNAYTAALNSPVVIEKGTRIVNYGDEITADTYAILLELNLIDNGSFDTALLLGVLVYVLLIFIILAIYLRRVEPDFLRRRRDMLALSLSYLLPIIAAVYMTELSSTIAPVYFAAVIVATYLGTQTAIVVSTLQILILLPVSKFDVEFIFVGVCGVIIASLIAGKSNRKYNAAAMIICTGLTCFVSSIALNLLMKSSLTDRLLSSLWAAMAGAIAVIAAIGFMPIFELISNTVSPLRLIELSQPGSPLLKRLFVEAPGTSQHSMMVANLADSAAEAIDANALLAKVGAYYHDIGKLDKPLYFTENQGSIGNPHDHLPPEESAAIILAHPDIGIRIGRRYRLPLAVLKIIQEHHGSTFQAYFYHKAKKYAEEHQLTEPQIDRFRYPNPIPSTRESAVVMLADTCEAAVKSTGVSTLEGIEELFRKLIKQKIDQDQLTKSCLSFEDIEKIIGAFVQVYTGVLHERVKYPDDSTIRK